ncbi:MAG: hypothetical protein JWM59_4501 [Verrucomicrobiales bacterium]|nr:hypothetical protein [Verrucomicrobiales bacterium]
MAALLPSFAPRLAGLCLAVAAMGLCSCQHAKPPEALNVQEAPLLFKWYGDHLTGPVNVKIVLSEQKAYITRGGEDAGWTYVAAGTPGHPTPPGSFRIIEKVEDKHSTSWGVMMDADGNVVESDAKNGRTPVPPGGRFVGAPMPYWMRIKGAIGMHAGHIPNPGDPASHGCIRLPKEMAQTLFNIAPLGTPVRVVR